MTLPEHMRLCLSASLPTAALVGDELIVHTNEAFAALLGADQHAAVRGRPARDAFSTQWAVLQPLVERAPTVATEVRLVLDRGEVFATIATTRSETGIVCTFIDTTEQVRAQRRLAALDQVVAVFTHDLRGHLGTAKTMVDVIRLAGTAPQVDELESPLRHAARLLDGVLEYSRISRGTVKPRRERIDLAQILVRAVELAGATATKVNVLENVSVLVDAERVASAVAHLLAHGETCELTGEIVGDRLRITIGCGTWRATDLAPMLARDFAPTTGFGLSLSFARGLVEHQGGSMIAHENSIVIEVPTETQILMAAPRLEAVRPKSRKRVLLVEDHDDAARSLKAALELLGYEVAIAHDGPVALTVARAFRPDVALLDIGLPVMDGYELANRLRSVNGTQRELHVVAVTAYGSDEFKRRSRDLGFAEHLVKPVDLARLERVVEALD